MAKTPRVYATVGPFTFAHPHITSPDTEGQYADNKYKVDGIEAPTSDAMKRAKQEVAAALKTLGVPKNCMLPLKEETMKNKETGFPEPTGSLLFRAKSQFAPELVDSQGQPIPKKVLADLTVGAGSRGLLQGYFSPYVAAGKAGVSFTLTGIQLLKVVKGRSGANFGAWTGEEGGFVAGAADVDDLDLNLGNSSDDDDEVGNAGDNGLLDI